MPEEFLNGADIIAALQEVSGKRVTKSVRGDVLLDACGFGGGADGFLKKAGVGVVTADFALTYSPSFKGRGESALTPSPSFKGRGESRVAGEGGGGEEVLPDQFAGSVGVFAGEGVGEVNFAEAACEVGLVDALDGLYLPLEGWDEGFGEDGGAVVLSFSVADGDDAVAEVYVFDAEADAFHKAKSASVEDLCHELGDAAHFGDDGEGFGRGEDNGEGFGFFGADDVGGKVNVGL